MKPLRLSAALLLLLWGSYAQAAAWVTQRTGNWSVPSGTASSPWHDGGSQTALNTVPGNGDTIDVATGHTLTQDGDYTIGTSPATATSWGAARNFTTEPAAIKITGTGALALAAGTTLTCRGDIDGATTLRSVTMGSGSTIILDSSAASSPSTTRYYMNDIKLVANGTAWTSGNFCTINGNGGGSAANGRFHCADASGSTIQATFLKFVSVGTSGDTQGIYCRPAGQNLSLVDCRVESCGQFYVGTTVPSATADVILRRVTFTGSLGTYSIGNFSCSAPSTGAREWTKVVTDKGVAFSSCRGLTLDNCIFLGFLAGLYNTNTSSFTEVKNCFFKSNINDDYTIPTTDFHDSYVLNNGHVHTTSTDHFIDADQTIYNNIYDSNTTDNSAREHILVSTKTGRTVTVRNCISTKNGGGNPSGILCSTYLGADTIGGTPQTLTFKMRHNTCFVNSVMEAAAWVGRIDTGHADELAEYKSNLVWTTTASNGYHVADANTNDSVNDLVSAANIDKNWGYNLATGSNGNSYNNLEFSTGTPGSTDAGSGDPSFVDSTRNLKTWSTALGGAGTYADAYAKMAKVNDTDFDSNYTVTAAIAYVQAGFKPRNVSLRNAGSDGVTIGAVEGQFPKGALWYYLNARNALERAILAYSQPQLSILTER